MTGTVHLDSEVVTSGFRGTWRDLPPLALPPVAAVLVSTHRAALAAVRAHALAREELLVLRENRADPTLRQELRGEGFALVAEGRSTSAERERSPELDRVWLLTSGSTGRPKRVAHSLDSLTTVRTPQPPRRWLCAYSPGTYAWWQLVSLALTQPEQGLVCVEPDELDRWPQIALREGVTAVSGTPTFWRHGLLRAREALERVPLAQVTIGGEPVDQPLLDALRDALPEARISWIYASSEAGAAIAVHDGLAGFPLGWLGQDGPERPRLELEGEELLVGSRFHGVGFEGMIRTGDRVEVRDGRVHIVGRLDRDEINIGGSKFSAFRVEQTLLAHPRIRWASVRSRRAPVVGQLLVAELVPDGEVSERELLAWCEERLPEYAVPRRLRFLDAIPITETLKSDV